MCASRPIAATDKALPLEAQGLTPDALARADLGIADLWTPALLLSQARLEHNASWMAQWCRSMGVELMPHGKTTMSPQLWHFQIEHGAVGITVATPWQARVAVEAGIRSIQVANELVDPHAARWIAHACADTSDASAQAPLRIWAWVDDLRTVARLEDALAGEKNISPIELLVDLGGEDGRTGARSVEEAVAVAEAVAASPVLRLAGVAGYEGALVHGRDDTTDRDVERFITRLLGLHDAISGLYDDGDVIVSAGGSAYPDAVARGFAAARGVVGAAAHTAGGARHPVRFVLRSGAYLIHDEGFYQTVSPFSADLLPAARAISRVVSQPEPGLAILDAGKRDLPYDEGLPTPRWLVRAGGDRVDLSGAHIVAMNDQHSFLRHPADLDLVPGDVVVLGLSHPCTMFDKWRRIPLLNRFPDDDADSAGASAHEKDRAGRLIGLIDTCF